MNRTLVICAAGLLTGFAFSTGTAAQAVAEAR
jgi:hypothetical protein